MRQLLFSVTKDDFDFEYFRGSGAGGQKKNKTSSACRCRHRASGAVGQAAESRQQSENKHMAFRRCVATKVFKDWLKIETAARAQGYANAERMVEKMMRPEYIREEVYTP